MDFGPWLLRFPPPDRPADPMESNDGICGMQLIFLDSVDDGRGCSLNYCALTEAMGPDFSAHRISAPIIMHMYVSGCSLPSLRICLEIRVLLFSMLWE